VLQIHQQEGEGDVLCFLTGEEEIEQACTEVREEAKKLGQSNLLVLPLYSSLPPIQ
jgi:pre-mRNA-splicing factor ATP-dependent RNA helicase DHX15/PRP43